MVTGFATQWELVTASEPEQTIDNDLAWEVMFVYGDSHPAHRNIRFAGMPDFDPRAVRQVLVDKIAFSEDGARRAAAADRCYLCRLPFGSTYADPTFGTIRIERNRRNRYICNICDAFIRICPGQATLTLPVMVIDVKGSRAIRRDLGDLREYSRLLASFQRRTSALIQDYGGFVLNTIGDAIVGVWPSGFIRPELRDRLGWESDFPARASARLAIQAASPIAASGPAEFDGLRLPYRAALDTTEMIIFSVTTGDPDRAEAFAAWPDDQPEVGDPVIGAEASDIGVGPAATDVAGPAIEDASELASDDDLPGGVACITRRTDEVAGIDTEAFTYREGGRTGVEIRLV